MNLPNKKIETQVLKIISQTKEIQPYRMRRKTRRLTEFGFDTVDVVDIILELEKNFKIVIPDEVPINTVGDFVDVVTSHTVLSEAC